MTTKQVKMLTMTAIFAVFGLFSACENSANVEGNGNQPGLPSGNSYTVVYNKNAADATGTMANSTFTIGSPQKLRINAFTRNGYNFSGWASSASGSAKYDDGELFDISTTPGATITLYAVWEEPTEAVPGATLPEKLAWLMSYAVSDSAYTVTVDAYYDIEPQYLFYLGRDNITIYLKGDAAMRTISLSSKGTLFKVGPGVTLVLDSNITLWGRDDNNASLVYVESGGSLIMNSGVKITGNIAITSGSDSSSYSYGGGVYVSSGTFTMNGGSVFNNTPVNLGGGGVFNCLLPDTEASSVEDETDFGPEARIVTFAVTNYDEWNHALSAIEFSGYENYIIDVKDSFSVTGRTRNSFGDRRGITVSIRGVQTISLSTSGNLLRTATAQTVILRDLTLYGISGNNTSLVYVGGGMLEMRGSAAITGNRNTYSYGGGVYVIGTFTMNGGEITGNTASSSFSSYGGGVYINGGIFNKTDGTIFGYSDGDSDSNVVKNSSGVVQQLKGHAVHVNHSNSNYIMGKDTTSGPEDNLSFNGSVNPPTYSGEWDY